MAFRIEHRLGVPASASAIWSVLGDLENWPQWTPLYPQVEGTLRLGATLKIVEAVGDSPPRQIEPKIADWEPEAQILWTVTGAAGLIKRTRYMEIEVLTETGCIIANGELYDGLGAHYVKRQHRRALYLAFEAFNTALRDRVLAQT